MQSKTSENVVISIRKKNDIFLFGLSFFLVLEILTLYANNESYDVKNCSTKTEKILNKNI